MGCTNDTAGTPGGNPDNHDDEVFARLVGMTEIRVLVGVEPQLRAIELVVEGLPVPCSVLLSDRAVVNLTVKLSHALGRLQGVRP